MRRILYALGISFFLLISHQVFAQAAGSSVLTWTINSGLVTPTNCSATATTCDREAGFNIYRGVNGSTPVKINSVNTGVATFTDSTPVVPFAPLPNNVYCYQVTSFNFGPVVPPATVGPMQESAFSNQSCKTFNALPLSTPAAPSLLIGK